MSEGDGASEAMQALPWQRAALADWLAQRDRLPHAWLIHGPAGYGKRELGLHFARSLLCEQPRAGEACGACPACHWFVQSQHPDFRLVEPLTEEDDTDKAPPTVVKIEQVRALAEFLQLTSHRHGAKVGVFYPAEAMNTAAANALLKTLEEPPPRTYLLLLSHQPRRLPATLRSRCRALAVPRPSADEAQAWLRAQGSTDPALHLAQAGGAPLRALACADASWQEGRRALYAALARPRSLSVVALGARLDAAPRAQRKEVLRLWCDWLCAWTHDLAAIAGGGGPRFNPDFHEPLARLSAALDPLALQRFYRALLSQRALLSHPLQPRLVAESLLLQYREALRGDS